MKSEDKFLWICAGVFFVIFLISGMLLFNYFWESRKQEQLNEELSKLKHGYDLEYFTIVEGVPIEKREDANDTLWGGGSQSAEGNNSVGQNAETSDNSKLTEINPDYVFWLEIPDSAIDYPVVYKNNEYYLKRDFYGQKNKHGTIFLDVNCDADGTFWLLHGHNMKDGTMFGGLREFKKKEYRDEHTQLLIDRNGKEKKYRIVAGVMVDLYDAARFVFEDLPETDEEAQNYFADLKKHAFWYSPFEWESGKQVVLLSTCDYETQEQRLVIFAVEE